VKPLAVWVVGFLVVLGVFSVVVNIVRDTGRVFVVVDSSFQMERVWNQVPGQLDEIDEQRFSEFALATEKAMVHSWSDNLRLGAVTPFAPCGFDDVAAYSEIGEADDLILITTPASCATELFSDWKIIVLEP
jgi:hypothetical protein